MQQQSVGYLWLVIVRSLTTGKVLNWETRKSRSEAEAQRRYLEELPDPAGHECRVEVRMETILDGKFPKIE